MKKRQLELAEKVADVGQEDFTHKRNAMSHKAQKMISSKAGSETRGSGQQMALDQNTPLEVDWRQAYKEQLKKCKSGVASMGF